MHVLMTGDCVGGVWQYSLDLAYGLSERRFQVTLALLGPAPSESQSAAAAEIATLRVVATGLPLDWTAPAAVDVLRAGEVASKLAASEGADIVVLHTPALVAYADYSVPVVVVVHSCVATWWTSCRTGPLPPDLVWRRDLNALGARKADALVAPTACFGQAFAREYGLSTPPRAVHNGRRQSRTFSFGRPSRRCFAAGRLWDYGKGADLLDAVAAGLSVPVLAAGSLAGPNGDRITLRHAHSLGHLSEEAVAMHLSARPIFLALARYEPFGLAVLEAAQAGCALVLSDIPTFRELWRDAALFVDTADMEATTRAIEALAHDEQRANALGHAARARADAYTVEAMSEGMANLFGNLADLGGTMGEGIFS